VEYGKKWHDAGTKMQNKMYLMISSLLPNTLSLKNIRRPTSFAIRGGSNGGLLVGNHDTATRINESSLASSRSDGHVTLPYIYSRSRLGLRLRNFTGQQRDEYIKGYSPVQNVKAGTQYPATMVTTGDHDDR
jgi:prolyl oligopeptidase